MPADEPTATLPDVDDIAGALRFTALRLSRLLRQQDDSGLAPSLTSALAIVERDGPLSLGELAAAEQVSPPTTTKVVEKLEAKGLLERIRDEQDRRVYRVRTTVRGRRLLEATRIRRTAWLANQLRDLPPEDLERVADALHALERITQPRRDPR